MDLGAPPSNAKAAVILIAGGHGGLQIFPSDKMKWASGNFVVRSRQVIAQRELIVATIDAPSDRQSNPCLGGCSWALKR